MAEIIGAHHQYPFTPVGTQHLPEGVLRVHTNDKGSLFAREPMREETKNSNNMWKRAMKKLEFSEERKPTREGKLHLSKS